MKTHNEAVSSMMVAAILSRAFGLPIESGAYEGAADASLPPMTGPCGPDCVCFDEEATAPEGTSSDVDIPTGFGDMMDAISDAIAAERDRVADARRGEMRDDAVLAMATMGETLASFALAVSGLVADTFATEDA